MLTAIDHFLDRLTMYRLMLYYLIVLVVVAIGLAATSRLPYDPVAIAFTASFLVALCWGVNTLFAAVFEAPTNVESAYITALILALMITPLGAPHDIGQLVWAGVLAMASKYILVWRRQNIFNPAAIAAVITAFGLGQAASWWVGNSLMLPAVILGGMLVARKLERMQMVATFVVVAVLVEVVINLTTQTSIISGARHMLLQSSLFFLGFVMLTEPATTPPTRRLRFGYGGLVGFLFVPQMHIGSLFSTPELALVIGNAASYLVSPRAKLQLRLKQSRELTSSAIDFSFTPDRPLKFKPGQYLEWTLPHKSTDSRGNRRYFTIASSPTEPDIHLGIRIAPHGSSFKRALQTLNKSSPILAGQLSGDFVLPRDPSRKVALIAGGIGITPYRSMIKYLVDTEQPRDVALLYAVNQPNELAYRELFEQARAQLGLQFTYAVAEADALPSGWQGEVGRIDAGMIKRSFPDYADRLFYISGPPQMVEGIQRTLRGLGVHRPNIKTDFFPGYV